MLIAHTTVVGAMSIKIQLKKNLITNWKGSGDYKEFPSKS